MPDYKLSLTSDVEKRIEAFITKYPMTKETLLRNAINTYITLKRESGGGTIFIQSRNEDGKLVVRSVDLP